MATQIKDIGLDTCVICSKATDQCCSLCRKAFYCSPEHQEVDWHMKHKFTCQGRTINEDEQNQFKIYSNQYEQIQQAKEEKSRSRKKPQVRDDKAIKQFLALLERRLQMRQKVLAQFNKINERSVNIVKQSLVHQTLELVELSQQIDETFKPSLTKYLSQQFGIFVNKFILSIESTADCILLCKGYDLCDMQDQVKQNIISLSKNLEKFPTSQTNQLLTYIQSYKGLLKSIIQISDAYFLDKISETMYGRYIKLIEQFEGIWEQIYAYFNIGVWYSHKTYYEKSIKSFMYALELINSHKKDVSDTILFRGDCHFNIALSLWVCGDKIKAVEQMQQAYQDRVNGIGKNSLEASVCLFKLAEWFRQTQKWEECLQYLDECHRIRKQHPENTQGIEEVKQLVTDVYSKIRSEKVKNEEQLQPKSANYYENLLKKDADVQQKLKQTEQEYRRVIPEQSFSSRLLRDEREFILFKTNITPQMFETYSPTQIEKLTELFERTDERMQKAQAIRVLMDSSFIGSLDTQQRQQFLKNNTIS